MERDAADNVRHELDGQFTSLRELIYAPDPSSSAGIVEQPSENSEGPADPIAAKLLPHVDDYDQHVRELAFDQRAKPKDRTKTEEELALEAKVELEEAERRRQRRMLGLPESEDENELGNRRGKRKRGADDIDDDFDEDLGEYEGLGVGLEQPGSNLSDEGDDDGLEDSAESDGGVEEGAEVEVESESDGEGLDEDDGDLDGEEGEFEQLITPPKTTKGRSRERAMTRDLPFTFPCPNSHDEFLEIAEDIDDKDVPTVVQRICALYHSTLAPDNKFKLQVCKSRPFVFTSSNLYSLSRH
jgi:nucleolar protein 14